MTIRVIEVLLEVCETEIVEPVVVVERLLSLIANMDSDMLHSSDLRHRFFMLLS